MAVNWIGYQHGASCGLFSVRFCAQVTKVKAEVSIAKLTQQVSALTSRTYVCFVSARKLLVHACASWSGESRAHISFDLHRYAEIKSFKDPPEPVFYVMRSVLLLLGYQTADVGNAHTHSTIHRDNPLLSSCLASPPCHPCC